MQFQYISHDAAILDGKPCIIGTRISVHFILQLIASGATVKDIAERYNHITPAAVKEAIIYASQVLSNEVIISL